MHPCQKAINQGDLVPKDAEVPFLLNNLANSPRKELPDRLKATPKSLVHQPEIKSLNECEKTQAIRR